MGNQYEDYTEGKLYQISYYLYGFILISLYFLLTNVLFFVTSFFALVFFQAKLLTVPLLFLAAMIAMIPMGPSWAAAVYTAKTIQNKEFHSITKNFFKAYKQLFKKSLYAWLTLITAFVLLFFNYWAILSSESLGFLVYTLFALALIIIAIGIYIFPLLIEYSFPVLQLLKLALYFSIKNMVYTILLIGLLFVFIYILISLPLAFFLILPGTYAFLQYLFCESVFKKILVDNNLK